MFCILAIYIPNITHYFNLILPFFALRVLGFLCFFKAKNSTFGGERAGKLFFGDMQNCV
jgi:hypothetical protein